MVNKQLKVSIVTPSYNQGEYIEETIQSVLAQTYADIEYIVIDGESTDNSVDIIRKYADKIDYWISEKDKGQADAINKGLRRATGDLVCWINSDDVLYPTFVETFVKAFEENKNVDFIYGNVEQGPTLQERSLRLGKATDYVHMLTTLDIPIPQQATMWKRSLMDKIGYLEPQWHVLLDREYFMRIAMHAKMLYLPCTLAFFRNHDQSKSVAEWHKWIPELQRYYAILFADTSFPYMHYRKQAMAAMEWECYRIASSCGMQQGAYASLRKVLCYRPFWGLKKWMIYTLVTLKHKIKR